MLLPQETSPITTVELQLLPCTILVTTTAALENLFRSFDEKFGLDMIRSALKIRLERSLRKGKEKTFSLVDPDPKGFRRLFGWIQRAFVHGSPLKNSAVCWAQYAIGNVFQFFGPLETHCAMFIQKTVSGDAEEPFAFPSHFKPRLVPKPDDKGAVELTIAGKWDTATSSELWMDTGFIFNVDSSGNPISLKSCPDSE